MFNKAVTDYKARQSELTRAAGEAEEESLQALDRALHTVTQKTNAGSSEAYRQQQEIGKQLKSARKEVEQLRAQSTTLAAAAEQLEGAALTFGDLENYLAVIQADIGSVAAALQRIQQQQQQQERQE